MENKDLETAKYFLRNYISTLENNNEYLSTSATNIDDDTIREQIEQNELIIGHFRKIKKLLETQQEEISNYKNRVHTLEEQIQMFIPRRRITRVYKMLGKILSKDIDEAELDKQLKSTNVDDIIKELYK